MDERMAAETLALQALGWIIGQDALVPQFLSATGAAPQDLAAQASDPVFLAAVLDFLLTEDALVMGFCDAAGLAYDRPLRARHLLPGGPGPHWT